MATCVSTGGSFDHLERYVHDDSQKHWPASPAYNKRIGESRGDVGIWRETYCIAAGQYDATYSGMLTFGLGKAGRLVPPTDAIESARERLSSSNASPA